MKNEEQFLRVGRNFQVTIPSEVRKQIDLSEGDYVRTGIRGDWIILEPIEVMERKKKIPSDNIWKEGVLKKFIDGYDESDSIYDKV